jgi:phosphoserine aminotransferase
MRVFNFSAGPAVLPEAVLQRAAEEMLDWRGSGMSVMEMSHRGKEFMSIAHSAEANFRQLLGIPSNYKVLFLQGGAMAMNALVPMNLLGKHRSADYVNTGIWSSKSISEAKKYCQVNVAASSEDKDFECWDKAHTLKEAYCYKTKLGFSGREFSMRAEDLTGILENALKKLEIGIEKAKDKKKSIYYTQPFRI